MSILTYRIGGLAHNSFDVDADGDYLYIAMLNEFDVPQVLKIGVDLTADAEVVFNPGAGSEVNVMAGDMNSGWVWATGDFGGTDKVVWSGDGGNYWFVQNEPNWVGVARPILVGPGNDYLLTTTTGMSIWQNRYDYDETIYWIERYIAGDNVWALDRVDLNVEETVAGMYWYSGSQVQYSPNSGFSWEGIATGLPEVTVTSLIAIR